MGDEILESQVNNKMRRPFLIVMEYIPGFDLENTLIDRSSMIFHPDIMKGYVPDGVHLHPPPKVYGYFSGST